MRSKEILKRLGDWFRAKLSPLSYLHFLIGFLSCVAVYYAVLGRYDTDEIEGFHTAWKISVGEKIYEDFFQHHHPLFYYVLVPIIKLVGEQLLALYVTEAFAFMVFVAITVISFLLARRIYDVKTALLSTVLLLSSPFFIKKGTEIRPDILQTLFGLLSFYMLTIYIMDVSKRKSYLTGSAVFLSLAFLSLQKSIFLIFLIGLVSLYLLWKRLIGKKDFLLYWSVFMVLPVVYLIYLLTLGEFGNYFDFNWLVNIKLMQRFSLFRYFPYAPVLFLLFLLGSFLNLGKIHRLVVFTGAGLLVSMFFAKSPYTQWILPAAPFVSMVAASSLPNLFKDSKTIKICLIFLVLFCAAYSIREAKDGRKKRDTISKIEYVLSVSQPHDAFYGGHEGIKYNLFRKDADFFWFCVKPDRCLGTYQSFRDYYYDSGLLINTGQPKVVFASPELDMRNLEMHNYEQSSKHKLFYIRKD